MLTTYVPRVLLSRRCEFLWLALVEGRAETASTLNNFEEDKENARKNVPTEMLYDIDKELEIAAVPESLVGKVAIMRTHFENLREHNGQEKNDRVREDRRQGGGAPRRRDWKW